ncbi:hypothetical protein R8871_01796 [Paraburkholderia graminis C4D1M]|jgi:hypothetical protein|uniref:Transmembrane protein n=2 Tax=Paraburkholderia graminis TaxID=60548 RepID=B1G1T7_PARG4|nr:hypothetical protein [Paraburkholderia graminis]EDT10050.1 conserved hypothetical protein [Paraburkholderia graminis C4D1M]MDQ0626355.1 uncharacterized protein (DUF952 family) [Paraburkholderia graminis]MDR6204659.1 uncharacterized protein (DUF952 family) [Paraburkholderia graminis]CAB3666522.1 hypothetical protein R8871_01796 [Paraburkholderia graminis C4D1M]
MGTQRIFSVLCAVAGAAALARFTGRRANANRRTRATPRRPALRSIDSVTHAAPATQAHVEAARRFNHSSALLAFSVLTDSAMEHYRGSFDNPAMYTPLVSASLSLIAGLHGGADHRQQTHHARHLIYRTAAAAGIAGTGFHLYNVMKRPGGWSWNNLVHAAPVGAPMALLLSGALGAVAERLRDEPAHEPQLLGMPAGRALGLLVAAGLIGTVGEAGLLHFRGSFQHRAMYAPVSAPPFAAALLAHAALAAPRERWFTRLWLRITTALGIAGAGFHARGIARRQGGWRNWSQNLFAGPPLPAPPSFSALALAGLAALRLRETEK